jgi:hypothetical protein
MFSFKRKKQDTTNVATEIKVKTTLPDVTPTFNEWCSEFRVSSQYTKHTPIPHCYNVRLQHN